MEDESIQQPEAVTDAVDAQPTQDSSPQSESQEPQESESQAPASTATDGDAEPQETEKRHSIPKERFDKFAKKIEAETRAKLEAERAAQQPVHLPWDAPAPDDPVAQLQAKVESLEAKLTQKEQVEQQDRAVGQFFGTVKQDAEEVVRKYPHLDPDSPSYDPDFYAEIQAEYTEQFEKYGIHAPRFIDVVNRAERIRAKALERGKSTTQATLAQQADEAALDPSSYRQPAKDFKDMSLEEMEARLGKVY